MAYQHEILDELQALKQDANRLLGARAAELCEASSQKATDIAADIKALLSDFRDALEEKDLERVFAGGAATALMLGIVIGWVLRRTP